MNEKGEKKSETKRKNERNANGRKILTRRNKEKVRYKTVEREWSE